MAPGVFRVPFSSSLRAALREMQAPIHETALIHLPRAKAARDNSIPDVGVLPMAAIAWNWNVMRS